MFNDVIKQL